MADIVHHGHSPAPPWRGRSLRRVGTLVALVAAVALEGAPSANATTFTSAVWQLRSAKPAGRILSGADRLRVVELFRNQALVYGERDEGINLVWGSPTNNNAYFWGRGQSPRARLRYGVPLAFHIQSGGFVRYKERDHGINLGWSSKPEYEWMLRGRNKRVFSVVRSGDRVALYNRHIGKYVVYGERDEGINLVWSTADPNTPTTATVRVSVRIGPFDASGVACAGALTWGLTPVGGFFEFDGRTAPVNLIQSFSETSRLSSSQPSGFFCTVSWQFFDLRPAVWNISPQLGSTGWKADLCNVTLYPGDNHANFSAGRPPNFSDGTPFCTQDSSFPRLTPASRLARWSGSQRAGRVASRYARAAHRWDSWR